jgi:hypothetical protein
LTPNVQDSPPCFGYGVIFSLLWFTLGVGIHTFVP